MNVIISNLTKSLAVYTSIHRYISVLFISLEPQIQTKKGNDYYYFYAYPVRSMTSFHIFQSVAF